MILAAGRGERMRPLSDVTPKPLLEAGGKALIVWQVEALARAGFRDIAINAFERRLAIGVRAYVVVLGAGVAADGRGVQRRGGEHERQGQRGEEAHSDMAVGKSRWRMLPAHRWALNLDEWISRTNRYARRATGEFELTQRTTRGARSTSVNAGATGARRGRRSATHALPRRATRLRRHSQSRVSRTARVPRDGRCGLATTATECADGGHRMLRFSNGRVQAAGGLRRARLGVPTVMVPTCAPHSGGC
jgi:hypothetical protein